jgi:hypothetical protein
MVVGVVGFVAVAMGSKLANNAPSAGRDPRAWEIDVSITGASPESNSAERTIEGSWSRCLETHDDTLARMDRRIVPGGLSQGISGRLNESEPIHSIAPLSEASLDWLDALSTVFFLACRRRLAPELPSKTHLSVSAEQRGMGVPGLRRSDRCTRRRP